MMEMTLVLIFLNVVYVGVTAALSHPSVGKINPNWMLLSWVFPLLILINIILNH